MVRLTRKGQWVVVAIAVFFAASMISPAFAGWVLAAEVLVGLAVWIGAITLAPWVLGLRWLRK